MENKNLKFEHVRLTPQIIETINLLQTGGTILLNQVPDKAEFTNGEIKKTIDRLTELSDFIIEVNEANFIHKSNKDFLKMLSFILEMKNYMKSFMAPAETES